ncbi:MAG: hypothetical protein JRI68_13420 [Deltaproteobacteria bacterium]|nr:hypothetical protein [Deltaproteobacteria bacterium]
MRHHSSKAAHSHPRSAWLLPRACVVATTLLIAPQRAAADAVPPPPDDCPPGTLGVTDHGGPRCEDEAPTDCPPGWVGVVGGHCRLHLCETDEGCPAGHQCREHSLCHAKQTRYFDYGSRTSNPRAAAPFIGAPPMELDEPIVEYVPVNVCDDQAPCSSPNECRPGKLCVPVETPRAAPMPWDATGAANTKPGGCGAGCSGAGSAAGFAGATALLAGIVTALGLRRRRRNRRPR